jgi:sucrose synthase
MPRSLLSLIDEVELDSFLQFIRLLSADGDRIILRNDIIKAFRQFLEDRSPTPEMTGSWRFLRRLQEVLVREGQLLAVYRQRRASCRILVLNGSDQVLGHLSIAEFLKTKEVLVKPELAGDNQTLELNLAPFYDYGPTLKDPHTIGHGIIHLNRYLFARLANQPERWNELLYEFLKLHHLHGVPLLLDGSIIRNSRELEIALEETADLLETGGIVENPERLRQRLRKIGFLEGWGDTPERIRETLHLLQDTLEQPGEEALAELLSRIPMVSKVVMLSPHGWFGQDNVLGRPDTGGQVVYILDQARALERYLTEDLARSGLELTPKIIIVTRLIPENDGTTSDQRLEKVRGARNVWILRVPFRDRQGRVIPQWLSRFRIWPYLDRFAGEVEGELRQELEGRPDLLIGNYSDGNLVATLLSRRMGVIQCNIAHALEKSKYLFSDLYWDRFEDEYHFSLQFMADLIAMNLTNFIVSSTSQEIIGTERVIGQYESYQFFTMPGLLRVTNGINLFHPRFNVIPPGVDNEVYFPYTEKKRRFKKTEREGVARMLFSQEDCDCLGRLSNPDLVPIFSIARLDRIKNLTGLVEAFGRSDELRARANLILVASVTDPARSRDSEEAAEINRLHELLDRYDLRGNVRWIGKMLTSREAGEAYRLMADRRGIFVQPALFEAFGLTILEAMHSGLPVFATQFGGPLEIIENGESGVLINPTEPEEMAAKISAFLAEAAGNPRYWQGFSDKGLARAQASFTWERHCRLLTRLTKVYGFWRYSISGEAKNRMSQYCLLLYQLFFHPRAREMEERE